jgi:hypothetical protein
VDHGGEAHVHPVPSALQPERELGLVDHRGQDEDRRRQRVEIRVVGPHKALEPVSRVPVLHSDALLLVDQNNLAVASWRACVEPRNEDVDSTKTPTDLLKDSQRVER